MAATSPVATSAPRFEPALMRRRLTGTIFYGACMAAIGVLLVALLALLVDVLSKGIPWLDGQFLTSPPSSRPERAGILPAFVGSLEIGLLVGLMTFPTGVAAAIYLQEYASDSRLNRLLQTNIGNLAGVPSIIYGILGLGLFVRLMELGPTVLAGALTLTLLILPVVIIASIEALKAVPGAQREGAYALGRDALADGSPVGPARGGARDHDRDHPGDGTCDRRGGAAHRDRRVHVRDVPAEPHLGPVHGPSDPDLWLGGPTAG